MIVANRGECCCCCPQIISLQSYFFQKEFFVEVIVFRHLNMDFTIFFSVILSDLSKHFSQFQDKNITVR